MTWECERCADEFGVKQYPTARDAQRYAAAFDRGETDNLGRRAPLIGLFPLRLWYKFRGTKSHDRSVGVSDPASFSPKGLPR